MLSVQVTRSKDVAIVDVPVPIPAGNEALVALRASSINRGELALIGMRDPGWSPGQDVAGVVIAAAADGSGPGEGARVAGLAEQGAWSEVVAVRASRLAVIPEGVSFASAAALPLAGLTALRTVRLLGSVIGRDVLITGASGGVGHLQVQLATLSGARVTAFVRSGTPDDGAFAVVNSIPGSGPFDAALDGIGGAVLADVVGVLRPGADVIWFGSSSNEPTPLTIYDFIGHEAATVRTYFSYAADTSFDEGDLASLLKLVSANMLKVDVSRSWDLSEALLAVQHLRAGGSRGKIVLTSDQFEAAH